MNKQQRKLKKVINTAYDKLHILNNITWSPYRDIIFNLNKEDEKKHRNAGTSYTNQKRNYEMSINDCSKMFTVKNISESILKKEKYNIKDLIRIRKSAIYSQSVVENYEDKILVAWENEDINFLSNLDYMSLINWSYYIESINKYNHPNKKYYDLLINGGL